MELWEGSISVSTKPDRRLTIYLHVSLSLLSYGNIDCYSLKNQTVNSIRHCKDFFGKSKSKKRQNNFGRGSARSFHQMLFLKISPLCAMYN